MASVGVILMTGGMARNFCARALHAIFSLDPPLSKPGSALVTFLLMVPIAVVLSLLVEFKLVPLGKVSPGLLVPNATPLKCNRDVNSFTRNSIISEEDVLPKVHTI